MKFIRIGFLLVIGIILLSGAASGDTPSTNPQAQAKYEAGESAREKGDWKTALEDYEQAIEMDPDFAQAHKSFIGATKTLARQDDADKAKNKTAISGETAFQKATRELEHLYTQRAQKEPNRAVYQYALGCLAESRDIARAAQFYKRAVDINPKFIEAYQGLAYASWRVGDFKVSRDYYKKAWDVNPQDAQLAFEYGRSWIPIDRKTARKVLLNIANRFSKDEMAIFTLGAMSEAGENEKEQLSALELIHERYKGNKSIAYPYRMAQLYAIYIDRDVEKALQLAQEFLRQNPENKDWRAKADYAQTILQGKSLIANRKYTDAINLLDKTHTLPGIDSTSFYLLKAKSTEESGDLTKAYEILISAVAPQPTDELNKALYRYAKKIGKNEQQIEDDLWQARLAKAMPLKDFELATFPLENGKTLKSKDLRGKVLLVNFWYPGCTYCRDEFPYVQKALEKYRNRGFEAVGVSIVPDEDAEVMPFMNSTGYKFIPLKVPNPKWASDNYKVWVAPSNLLIDGEGRVIFRPQVRDEESERTFELQIEALLARLPSLEK